MSDTASVLTLITHEEKNLTDFGILQTLSNELSLEEKHDWLAKGQAMDLFLDIQWEDKKTPLKQKQKITNILAPHPIDFALQPCKNRRKKLLISDMDSTIIEEECIDEIAFMAGIKPKIADITERAMRGELDFEDALIERVGLLKGLETTALETVINERLNLSKGARTTVQTMAKHGAYCALVSGGFTYFTEKIAAKTGFHITQANTLEMDNGKLTGNVIPPILGSKAKKVAMQTFTKQQNIQQNETLAVGDGANDLEMITNAGLGVAYKAKPIVAKQAMAAINHTDLTSLLYMQGYKHNEFIKD